MRAFTLSLTIVLLTAPAFAQGMPTIGGKRPTQGTPPKFGTSTPKVDDKAYKAALERIPNQSSNPDPWQNMRATEPQKKNPN